MTIPRDQRWHIIMASVLRRVAVRVVFIGPEAEPDPRIEQAKKQSNVQPMDPAFFESISEFLKLAEEKTRMWSEAVKPKADAAVSKVWQAIWKTPQGRQYQELKAEVDRRKSQVDAICKKAEDGVARKILAGGKVVTFLKTSVLVGREDMLEQARQDVERLKSQLVDAKERLKALERGSDDAYERLNMLVVEELKEPTRKPSFRARPWTRSAGVEAIQEGFGSALEIEDLIADELVAADGVMDEFVAVLENVAAQEISDEDLHQMAPEMEGQPAEPVDV